MPNEKAQNPLVSVQGVKAPRRGRKSDYSPALGEKICEALAEGLSLNKALRASGMPGMSTVMRWLNEFEEFRDLYIAARRFQNEMLCDELRDIADDANSDEPWRAQLRVNARKFLIARMTPRKHVPSIIDAWVEPVDPQLLIEVDTGVPDDGDGL